MECAKGDIRLAFCRDCGCIRNVAFDPRRLHYDTSYENSLDFSPAFQQYAETLARDLIERYNLRDGVVVEIGCGKGEFLATLCELGGNRGIGFDPSYVHGRGNTRAGKGIEFVTNLFSDAYSRDACDFVCCRHVLEHVGEPRTLLANIPRRGRGQRRPVIYFEVPNGLFTLRDSGMWDIIYQHCSYFTPASLRRLFTSCGFEILAMREAFGGQYLAVEASPAEAEVAASPENDAELQAVEDAVADFSENYQKRVEELAGVLSLLKNSGKRAVLWGAGAKGMMFLNKFKGLKAIEYVVDINPYKQGKFVEGAGQEIVSPEFLRQYRPEVIFLANANYRDEIERQVRGLGIEPSFAVT